jgi:LacI family transcriptional regulator
MTRRPTQRQIARLLGVSPATVSLALNDSPMISADTRRLVREAVAAAGYVPNAVASSLRTGRTRIVGVSFHNIAHQFFAEMLIAVEETLGAAGVALFLNNHGEDPAVFGRFLDSLCARGADGLLVSPPRGADAAALAPIRRLGLPVVYVSRRLRDDDAADWVVNDDAAAAACAAERLLALGHQRLVLLGGEPGTTVAEDRLAGFRRALRAAGLPWDDGLWVQGRARLVEGARALRAALAMDPRPSGFVCFNDLVAFGALGALGSLGLRPGVDVGVVGIGGTDEAGAFHPALTTVLDSPARMGQLAAQTLLRRLAEPDLPPIHVTLAPRPVLRESCGGGVPAAFPPDAVPR